MAASSGFHPEFWKGLFLGLIGSSLALFSVVFLLAFRFLRKNDVYDNDHWKLNVKVPFTTMWMNMGYWINADGQPIQNLEQACRALLHQVLAEAGLLETKSSSSSLAVLDLGIGCGDQSLELARLFHQSGWAEYRYVGLTLNKSQFQLASQRLFHESRKTGTIGRALNAFQADAARPDTWGSDVRSAIRSLADVHSRDQARWVLGLDSLYHFFPNRRAIFSYAANEFDASFMAFDLILSDTASLQQKMLVKLVGLAMGCPASAFVTEAEYKTQLGEAGYDEGQICFRDITDHVFSGLIDHIKRQEEALRIFGISVGKFKVAGKVFSWFARSKALRTNIVVAHKKPKRL